MAQGKKSFLIYCDLIKSIDHLTNEEKGILFQHLLEYVNDMNPVLEDRLILTAWKPIENQLKRDLTVWEKKQNQRIEAGKRSAEVRKQNATTVNDRSISSTVIGNGNGNGNGNANEIIDKSITYKEKEKLFLEDWNELRLKHLKKKSNIKILDVDSREIFKELIKNYSREDMQQSIIGLFKQKKLPNGNTSMHSNPKHFLKFFNTYLTAYQDKNECLYGEKEVKQY